MKQFLLKTAAPIFRRKIGQTIRKGFLRPCVGLSILLLVLLSTTAFASHFKGGYFTYTYLGEGQYKILITSYWDKSEVGKIHPRYQGYPTLDNSPVSLSQTLLEDGETVEHVQRQIVTWSNPGVYQIFWRSCCRGEGANFNNNFMGMYATVNYNPEAPSSSPQFNDDRSFAFNSRQRINYSIQMEDPEGHVQDFSLEIPYGLSADVYQEMLDTGFQLTTDGNIVWENPLEGTWLVNIRLHEKIDGIYTGAYIDREININVSAPGNKPDKGDKKGGNPNARSNAIAGDLTFETGAIAGIRVYPHPVQEVSQLKLALEEADWVKIDVIDLSGKVVKNLYAGTLEAKQELSLEISSRELGAGKLYIGRLITSKGVQTFKLAIQ